MAHGKKSFRGKRKFHRYNDRPKPKKNKFNLKDATYVKDRDIKNREIEKRRQMLEEEKLQQQSEIESNSSGDE